MLGFFVNWYKLLIGYVLVSGLVITSGCTTQSSTSGSSWTTEKSMSLDEAEVRRRAHIRLELAANYFESGQTAVALDEVKQSLLTDPTYADAYNLRGLIYMRLNQYAQAESSFSSALNIRANDPGVMHNYAWLLCQQEKYAKADQQFEQVLTHPTYAARSKTLMAQGLCRARAGENERAENTLSKAYELDASNPIIAYNLANLLLQRGDLVRAQFYIRRLNNSDLANAESLWLGMKVEHTLGDSVALRQLASQLKRRFADSREQTMYERGAFNE